MMISPSVFAQRTVSALALVVAVAGCKGPAASQPTPRARLGAEAWKSFTLARYPTPENLVATRIERVYYKKEFPDLVQHRGYLYMVATADVFSLPGDPFELDKGAGALQARNARPSTAPANPPIQVTPSSPTATGVVVVNGTRPTVQTETFVAGSEGTSFIVARTCTNPATLELTYYVIPLDVNPFYPITTVGAGIAPAQQTIPADNFRVLILTSVGVNQWQTTGLTDYPITTPHPDFAPDPTEDTAVTSERSAARWILRYAFHARDLRKVP